MNQINTLYTVNLHNVVCQTELNKKPKPNQNKKQTKQNPSMAPLLLGDLYTQVSLLPARAAGDPIMALWSGTSHYKCPPQAVPMSFKNAWSPLVYL